MRRVDGGAPVSDYRVTDDRDPTGMSGPHRWCVKYRVESARAQVDPDIYLTTP